MKIGLSNPNNVFISLNFDNIKFSDFSNYVYSQTKIKVLFHNQELNEFIFSIKKDNISVFDATVLILKNTPYKVFTWHNCIIVSKEKEFIQNLPNYIAENSIDSLYTIKSAEKIKVESEENYLVGRKPDVLEHITIGKRQNDAKLGKVKISGRIVDSENGEPIIGATINIEELGTGSVSDRNGMINLALNSGKYNVIFECLGYKQKKYLFEILSNGDFSTLLEKEIIPIQEVVVKGDRKTNITSRSPGMERITPKSIKEIPMMMGERDIIKISETLPGIVSVGEGSSGLNVRGGGSDQNLFYLNKIPIYNTFHVFGFFPAFNSDIIKDFSIYKGFVPLQYGGRISSIFNVITKQGNRKSLAIRGGINPITANMTLEGPIKKDTSALLLSARTSYSDWLLGRIDDPTIKNSNSKFYDISAYYSKDFNSQNQLGIFYYLSNDYFKLSDISTNSYSNQGMSINWRHSFSSSLRGEFSVIGSNYSFSTLNNEEPTKAYKHNYKLEHYEARSDFSYLINEKFSLESGVNLTLYKLNKGVINPYGEESLRLRTPLNSEKAIEPTFYLSNNYDISNWLNIVAGVRYSFFCTLGPNKIYKYTPGGPIDELYITDTISYKKNQLINTFHLPEVRTSLTFKTDDNGSIKVSYNQTHQSIFMLSNTLSIAPNTQWKLSDSYIKPTESQLISLGIFRNIPKQGLEISVEAYLKKTKNFTDFKDGANFVDNPITETQILSGVQSGYGVEFLIKRTGKKIEGWLSYTYSQSTIKINGPETWQKINEGKEYASNYDIPHVVNLVANTHLTRRITLSTIATYQTGKPVTYPLSIYYVNGIPYIDYSSRNEFRIPDYFRLDFSLAIEGNLKKKKKLHSSFVFSLYNVTGRKNPYTVYFKSENGIINGYKYSVIGIPLFTFTWQIKLGNYATD